MDAVLLYLSGVVVLLLIIKVVVVGHNLKNALMMLKAAVEMDRVMFDALRIITLKAKGYDPIYEARMALCECGKIANKYLENENVEH